MSSKVRLRTVDVHALITIDPDARCDRDPVVGDQSTPSRRPLCERGPGGSGRAPNKTWRPALDNPVPCSAVCRPRETDMIATRSPADEADIPASPSRNQKDDLTGP